MGFLVELFRASFLVGVPIAVFTFLLVRWALRGGHFKQLVDTRALKREIKAMSRTDKKKTKAARKEERSKLHPVQRKWAKFGGGFYGIVAFFTYIVIEAMDIFTTIASLGGFIDFLRHLSFDLIIRMLVEALTNFISAMVWPVYWMGRIETQQVWVWFLMAYAGYWAGLKLAQTLVQRR